MTDQEFNLATADKHQLKKHASQLTPSLSLTLAMTENTMRERIQEHCIINDLDQPVARVDGSRGKKHAEYITINIAKQNKKDGSEPAFVGIQGVGYTIPRGINVAVPASVVEVLKNAIQDIVSQDPDDGELYHEDVMTYPFQVVSGGN